MSSIRMTFCFRDWNNVDSETLEQQYALSHVTDKFLNIREIKRNLFSPAFLQIRNSFRADDRTPSIHVESIPDLIGDHIRTLQQKANTTTHRRGTRRSKAERKQDWNDAIDYIINAGGGIRSIIPDDQSLRIMLILPSILSLHNLHIYSVCEFLSCRNLYRPYRKVVVASLETNMWFDLENLQTAQRHSQAEFSSRTSNSCRHEELEIGLNRVVSEAVGLLRSNTPQTQESLQISVPILRRPNSVHFHIGSKGTQRPDNVFSSTCSILYLQPNLTSFKELRHLAPQLEKTLVSARNGLFNQAAVKHFLSNVVAESAVEKLDPQRSESTILKKVFVPDRLVTLPNISQPVATSSILGHETPNPDPSSVCGYERDGRQLRFVRPRSVSFFRCQRSVLEQNLCSTDAREIMAKSAYKRPRLLAFTPDSTKLFLESELSLCWSSIESAASSPVKNAYDTLYGLLSSVSCTPLEYEKKLLEKNQEHEEFFYISEAGRKRDRLEQNRKVRLKLSSYDPPQRRRSTASMEFIVSVYGTAERTQKSGVLLPGEETNQNSSDESILEDFVLSDDDNGRDHHAKDALQTLIGMARGKASTDNDLLDPKQSSWNINPEGRQGMRLASAKPGDHDTSNHVMKVRLRVPRNLVCSPWTLKVAEHFIAKTIRGSIFVPPSLSLLPVITIIINSYLSEQHCDHRIAVICESETDAPNIVYSYLDNAFSGTVSINIVYRKEYADTPRLAPLVRNVGRVVILDSFAFDGGTDFSLLIILCEAVPSEVLFCNKFTNFDDDKAESISSWKKNTSILIAPYHARYDSATYVEVTAKLSKMLDVYEMLFVDERHDILNSMLISRPDMLHLVPQNEVVELVEVLERSSKSCYDVYRKVMQVENREFRSFNSNFSLDTVSVVALQQMLSCVTEGPDRNDLELLFKLRNARSYALCDGHDVAVDYLKQCMEGSDDEKNTITSLVRLLEDAQPEQMDTSHPMIPAIRRCLNAERLLFLEQPPSIRSMYRRTRFKALLVTESRATLECLLDQMEDVTDALEEQHGDIVICERHNLVTRQGKSISLESLGLLSEFSHVFHIIGDRYQYDSPCSLPPQLTQYVHACRTRLLTIAVDMSKKLEDICKKSDESYSELAQVVCALNPVSERDISYISQVSLNVVCGSTLADMIAQENAVVPDNEPHGNELDSIRFTVQDLMNMTTSDVQNVVRKQLEQLQRSQLDKRLQIILHVRKKEKCTPCATFLFAAIIGDKFLHEHTEVSTLFD